MRILLFSNHSSPAHIAELEYFDGAVITNLRKAFPCPAPVFSRSGDHAGATSAHNPVMLTAFVVKSKHKKPKTRWKRPFVARKTKSV
jgi:hypothetical protein